MTQAFATLPMFFYGSLQDRDLLSLVLDRSDLADLALIEAELDGHVVERVAEETFPMVIAAPGRRARGLLVDGLSHEDRARVAFFEDSDYRLHAADVVAAGSARTATFFAPTEKLRSSGEIWAIEDWPPADRTLLLACAEEMMSYFGRAPSEVVETWWPEIKARAVARIGA